MVRNLRSTLVTSVLLLAAACSDDTVAPTGGGPEGGGGGGEGGAPPVCTGMCLAIPAGFQGPVELKDSGVAQCTNPDFEGGYIDGTFSAPEAQCGCACEAVNVTCQADATVYEDAACGGVGSELSADPPSWAEPPSSASWLSVSVATNATGSCQSDDGAAVRPAITFDQEVDGCGVNLDLCEGGDTCFPESVLTYCVYSFVQSECPEGFEDERRVIQLVDLEDTRDCSCACGAGTITCSSEVTIFEDACVTGLAATDAGGCVSADGGQPIAALEVADSFTADCGEPTTSPSGDVTVTGEGVLVCCRP
ncbi:MAG: hypothetical protein IPM79_13585 [Polyangiaceae bacterium]|nr:hypothetical protein [Polyangiaceae bacterium]